MSSAGKKVRVTKAFPPDFFDGLTLPGMTMESGDVMTVHPDSSGEWPAFALVVKGEERGWVPKRYLNRKGEQAIAIRRYDTTTLNPCDGDILTVIEEDLESGWYWCRDELGNLGWFAMSYTSPISD